MVKKCQFMIFGATGDLTYKKLLPAIFSLYKEGELCDKFKLILIGRRSLTLEDYLKDLDVEVTKQLAFHNFKDHLTYHQMDFSKQEDYEALNHYLSKENWVFYLATAPRFFEVISSHLDHYGYLDESAGFRRIVFEKPFGINFSDAKKINKHISKILDESQIFRIDHYLGKEMIQNILLTRAYNSFIEMLWHKDAIDYFEIVISEESGVHNRAGYYDGSGALKDMVQNHMFQIVALLSMDLPESLIPEVIQEEKSKILKQIKVMHNLVVGQYQGYLDEKGVKADSETETFVAMEVHVDNRRWKDTPFYLKTGKALKDKYAQVVVHFKKMSSVSENLLIIQIQPDEGIKLKINSKKPGVSNEIDNVTMDYCHSCLKYGDEPSAYGRLLLDVILGDKSLFASWDEIESSWHAIDKIEKIKPQPLIYEKHSDWHENLLIKKGWYKYD
ncbi:glucose-6-phosphate dehydrogenase [Acidaminobacter sp. JC074]|uniref:glucose-6-phosphate dehydrogenase n=1 Tax=Acidaminobacter sp. JC074 TaxID=2530199 RepID=UPI001F11094E|nr:glucose-6-phosphate dehydrogenase [Acidaminobacter sp. JC074]